MEELVTLMAKSLVDLPDEVSVSVIEGDHTSVVELRVAKTDLGKVIGRHGRTAQAMRTILLSASARSKKRTLLEIID